MKNVLSKILFLGLVAMFFACNDDAQPTLRSVGLWRLEGFTLENFADDFADYEGMSLATSQLGISAASLELKEDGTFVAKTTPVSGTADRTNGTWAIADGKLMLTYAGDDEPFIFPLEKDEYDHFWYRLEGTFPSVSDSTWNALIEVHGSKEAAQEFFDGLTDGDKSQYYSNAVCSVVWKFVRVHAGDGVGPGPYRKAIAAISEGRRYFWRHGATVLS